LGGRPSVLVERALRFPPCPACACSALLAGVGSVPGQCPAGAHRAGPAAVQSVSHNVTISLRVLVFPPFRVAVVRSTTAPGYSSYQGNRRVSRWVAPTHSTGLGAARLSSSFPFPASDVVSSTRA
jgi:hypothetical protein